MSPARHLLSWYDRHRRDLPWRRSRDPYRVWLSEIMLQQTRVDAVIPYFERFLERFPTVEALAAAEIDEVLARWSGLGYYRRARQLHRAAGQIVTRGSFPRTPAELQELPGIGPYTAAAVASIAFGVAEPVLDGNVERLLSRLHAVGGDPRSRENRRRLLVHAAELLDRERPGDGNQALMELGATVCTPRRPRCLLCPLNARCRALAEGDPERYPPPRKRRATERHRRAVAVVQGGERLLLFRRPEDSALLAGTWELPWIELPPGDDGGTAPEELAAALGRRYGGRWSLGHRRGTVRHGITYRAIEVEIFEARFAGDDAVAEGPEAGWFTAAERRRLPLSSLVGKVLSASAP